MYAGIKGQTILLMRMIIPLLLAFLTASCGAPSTEQTATAATEPVAETAAQPVELISETETTTTLTACEVFTAADFNDLVSCGNLNGPNSRETSRGSTTCSFSCSEPFAMLIVTLGYNKKGYASVIERKKGNPVLENIALEGTDGIAFQPQQFRFDIYKGKHSINFVVPDTGGDKKVLGLKMAKLMVSRLP
jgi:hypothetical protein